MLPLLLIVTVALINGIFAQVASSDSCSSTLDYLMRNYVLPSTCANGQNASNAAPPAACPPSSSGVAIVCPVNLLAWGYQDNSKIGHIIVNGTTIVDTSDTASNVGLGFYITVINTATCAASLVNYSPFNVPSDAGALAKHLQGLASGTVIAGVTADTTTDINNQNLLPAISTLQKIGITNAQNLNVYRSKLAFVAQIGNPSAAVYQLLAAGGPSAQLNVNVQGWIVPPVTFTQPAGAVSG